MIMLTVINEMQFHGALDACEFSIAGKARMFEWFSRLQVTGRGYKPLSLSWIELYLHEYKPEELTASYGELLSVSENETVNWGALEWIERFNEYGYEGVVLLTVSGSLIIEDID